jgi:hypothetical protein
MLMGHVTFIVATWDELAVTTLGRDNVSESDFEE